MAAESKAPLKVFLCHASGDKPVVRELYKRLIAEGVDAWLDQEKLLPGQDWRVEIPRAVREADVVVICLSNKSITKEGYVQKEIRFALDSAEEKPEGTIFLIPARLEDCAVPHGLDRWQWVDLFEENGFIRLLRSLKLRADRVGAVIEPSGYEESDSELEQRLDQLYTEGLAAFWVEDWDRACQRFQAILRERPNHKNATEKLAQAERQRNFAKLYGQATEAYQAENWMVAGKVLGELLEKSGDYKDAAQLLKDVKKQSQLRELYAEAKRLHAAQKWQAVVRIFDQIAGLEPAFPEPEGLLASAQRELVELKRQDELNDLYSRGIHKIEAGQWYEARTLLEQVHKAQTGFRDTERLLKKVENEILKIEELNQRNIQVNTLYQQVQKLVRSKNWHKAFEAIEEIRRLDDQFVDGDGIFERVRTELDREAQETQRQRELGTLYAEAVSLLEAKKYQEALEKWNAIQAMDPNYKDTARVRTIAKRKLDELSTTESVTGTWQKKIEGWTTVEVNISSDRVMLTEKLLLLSFAVTLAIGLLYALYINVFDITSESSAVVRFLSYSILGFLYGSVLAFALSKTISSWQQKHSWFLMIVWLLGFGLTWSVWNYYFDRASTPAVPLLNSVVVSTATVAAIKWARPTTSPFSLVLMFAVWVLAWNAGSILGNHLAILSTERTFVFVASAFIDGLVLLLGLLFTFGAQVEGSWDILKRALFGALGFGVGNYALDLIPSSLLSLEILFAVWGLIAGAILEAPSRDWRRIVSSAAVGGAGLLLGAFVAYDLVPATTSQTANELFSDKNITLAQPFLGLGLGAALGLMIRRASPMGLMAILGAGVYLITRALNEEFFNLSVSGENLVRGAIIGFVLGFGYGYLRRAKPVAKAQHTARTVDL